VVVTALFFLFARSQRRCLFRLSHLQEEERSSPAIVCSLGGGLRADAACVIRRSRKKEGLSFPFSQKPTSFSLSFFRSFLPLISKKKLHLHENKTKKIIFVRHGEHAYLNDTDTPCMSEIGMARAVMLTRYLARPDAPKGVLPPTMVYAMNGNTKESDPLTVRPINSAIPIVVSKRIARDKFVTRFGQRTPADVAASMLSEGRGEVVLNIWLHWEVPPMINFMGVPVTGWNNDNLDEETQATYKVRRR
jgi:hypothetical protein